MANDVYIFPTSEDAEAFVRALDDVDYSIAIDPDGRTLVAIHFPED